MDSQPAPNSAVPTWISALFIALILAQVACSEHQPTAASSPAPGTSAPDSGDSAPRPPSTPQQVFAMDPFEIAAGSELYECQDLPNPFAQDVAIIKTESTVTFGSHHMFAFRIPASSAMFTDSGTKGPIFDCPSGGLEFHPYFHLTQRSHDVVTYPPGVGRLLNATDAVRMNIHFLNPSSTPITASGEVTVSYVDPSAVSQFAAEIFIYSNSLMVPLGISTQGFSYRVTSDMKLLQVNGHMHQRGTNFDAVVVPAGDAGAIDLSDARPLYSTNTWNEPPSLELDPAFDLGSGDIIHYSCSFDNETGGALTYGQSAATNEMCNLFGVFYPSPDGTGILAPL